MQISVTDAAGFHLDQDFAGARLRHWHILDLKRVAELCDDGGFHGRHGSGPLDIGRRLAIGRGVPLIGVNSDHGKGAITDLELAESYAQHARLYFDRTPLDLDLAAPGTFGIVPAGGMLAPLKTDYEKMAGMIFGQVPPFDEMIERIAEGGNDIEYQA
ncbi:hypothetical protein ACFFWD_15870 [Bradyrhizobium erythrophlei]|uniref:hypothetical protein n=1 Tax=Bradyrhizobium erythrophlei TaxID=1437360 RepID=UPI0035E9EBE6